MGRWRVHDSPHTGYLPLPLPSFPLSSQHLYTVTGDSLRGITLGPNGSMVEIQELKDGVQDSIGQNIQYFSGLTALTVSPDGANVYAVGTTVMPAIGGEATDRQTDGGRGRE